MAFGECRWAGAISCGLVDAVGGEHRGDGGDQPLERRVAHDQRTALALVHVDQLAGLLQAGPDVAVLQDMRHRLVEAGEVAHRLVLAGLADRPELVEAERLGALVQRRHLLFPAVVVALAFEVALERGCHGSVSPQPRPLPSPASSSIWAASSVPVTRTQRWLAPASTKPPSQPATASRSPAKAYCSARMRSAGRL